jgi:hypothetical protein
VIQWLTTLKEQRVWLEQLKHVFDDTHFITLVLAALPIEYDDLVDSAKIALWKDELDVKELPGGYKRSMLG